MTRRTVLLRFAQSLALLVLAGPALLACSRDPAELDRRLLGAARSHIGPSPGGARIARLSGWQAPRALTHLRNDLGAAEGLWVSSSAWLFRRFVAQRRERDLAAGRLQHIAGWLLTETEIAVAVIANA